MNSGIYKEDLIERYKHPENKGELLGSDILVVEGGNESCGDSVKIYLRTEGKKIIEAKFVGVGCVISQVSADMLMNKILGMSLDEVKKMEYVDVLKLLGVELSSARKKCAFLALSVLKEQVKTNRL